jgi:hypothetical protein
MHGSLIEALLSPADRRQGLSDDAEPLGDLPGVPMRLGQ